MNGIVDRRTVEERIRAIVAQADGDGAENLARWVAQEYVKLLDFIDREAKP